MPPAFSLSSSSLNSLRVLPSLVSSASSLSKSSISTVKSFSPRTASNSSRAIATTATSRAIYYRAQLARPLQYQHSKRQHLLSFPANPPLPPPPTPRRSLSTTASKKMAAELDHKEGVHNLLDKKSFDDALAQPGAFVIDCYAEWCGPCKVISPKFVEESKRFPSIRFYKVDVDNNPDVAQELGIAAMPTFKAFKDGELVDSLVGAHPVALREFIEKLSQG